MALNISHAQARMIVDLARRLPQFRDGKFEFRHWDEDPLGRKSDSYIMFRDYKSGAHTRYDLVELHRMVNVSDPYNPLLKGEVGRIDGVSFVDSSDDNFIEDVSGSIEKRTGFDDMSQRFKEIDAKIKKDWGK